MKKQASHTSPISIRFNDIDAFGHVNNAIYLTYFEEGRKKLFDKITGKSWNWVDNGVLLAHNQVDYLLPLQLNDEAYIETTVAKIGNKSMDIIYRIFKIENGKEMLCTRGKSVLVSFDFKKQVSIPVPPEWRKAVEDFNE